ncbi:MAG: AraC family transcriptional regulator [Leptolyngbyaceae cyanobacterium bins.302]|nr:AraC family transcriptional regulator [Leptolyngbyaceae cyanobacterium bins.302]
MKEATFSIALIRNSLHYAAAQGLDPQQLCRAIELDPALLDQPDSRVSGETSRALWHAIIEQTGDRNIGLHIGERFNLAALGMVGYVLFNCQTFGQVLDKLSRYMSLFSQGVSLHVTPLQGEVVCDWEIVSEVKNYLLEDPRQPIEVTMSALLTVAKTLTGQALRPLTVSFQYACPVDISEHQRIFGTSIRFSQPHNRMVLEAACLDWRVISANASLLAIFEQHAQSMLADLNQTDTCTYQVTREITQLLRGEVPAVETVAQRLMVSVRHLQRSLQAEGTSYQQILDSTRKDLAVRHLQQPHTSIHDVAFLLGFSEPSAFHRAFKRWTGQTPRDYRLTTGDLQLSK